ncbi:hypothetical protein MTO96_020186 [Rhipicephalus appendiculatus]
MEYEQKSTPVVVKRPLEVDEGNDKGAASAGEPLPKAPFIRRPTLKIQPKESHRKGTNEGDKPRVVPGTKAETAAEDDGKAASNSSADVREVDPGETDVDMTAAGGIATKRAREASDSTGNVGTSGTGEPPTKTATGRRPTFKPRPNLPSDRGETPKTPPH